ncbi:CBN-EMB-1 protein [Caenorhabditis brenneri]|uniref:CBN-EMB-1 protein n=1 Tax=Caenorhabditis brenneri TaxID=135651 RepID=G0N3K1_CAEBE|nr:CBN-EMB-1 protein [Caenorhabditis brenneri]
MAMMYPFHVALPPLKWAEHLWTQEITPPKESFITTICEHRQAQWDSQDLLTHLQDSVALLTKEDQRPATVAPESPVTPANAQNS